MSPPRGLGLLQPKDLRPNINSINPDYELEIVIGRDEEKKAPQQNNPFNHETELLTIHSSYSGEVKHAANNSRPPLSPVFELDHNDGDDDEYYDIENPSSSPTEHQKFISGIRQRASNVKDIKQIEKEKLQKQAAKRLRLMERQLVNQVEPWTYKQWQTWASGFIGMVGSGSTASSVDYFANRLLGPNLIKEYPWLRGMVTTAAGIPTALLSLKANNFIWGNFLRDYSNLTLDDLKRSAGPLLITALSAFASFRVNWNAWAEYPLEVRLALSLGRAIFSAPGSNFVFFNTQVNNIRGDKDIPTITFLKETKTQLRKMAASASKNPQEYQPGDSTHFIDALDDSSLFKILVGLKGDEKNPDSDPKERLNNVFRALLNIAEGSNLEIHPRPPGGPSVAKQVCEQAPSIGVGAFGFIGGGFLMYLEAGYGFLPLVLDESAALMKVMEPLLYWFGGLPFAVSSALVNGAQAAISLRKALNDLWKIKEEGFANHFKKYDLKDWILLLPKLYCIVGYALSNAGMAKQFPPFTKAESVAWIASGVSFVINLANGSFAINTFINSMVDLKERYVLLNAIEYVQNGGLLKNYYAYNLNDRERSVLVRLLDEYLKFAIDSLVGTFNTTGEDLIPEMLMSDVFYRINNLYAKVPSATPSQNVADPVNNDNTVPPNETYQQTIGLSDEGPKKPSSVTININDPAIQVVVQDDKTGTYAELPNEIETQETQSLIADRPQPSTITTSLRGSPKIQGLSGPQAHGSPNLTGSHSPKTDSPEGGSQKHKKSSRSNSTISIANGLWAPPYGDDPLPIYHAGPALPPPLTLDARHHSAASAASSSGDEKTINIEMTEIKPIPWETRKELEKGNSSGRSLLRGLSKSLTDPNIHHSLVGGNSSSSDTGNKPPQIINMLNNT